MTHWKSSAAAVALMGLVLVGGRLDTGGLQLSAAKPVAVQQNPDWIPDAVPLAPVSVKPVKAVKAPAPVPIPGVVPVNQIARIRFTDLTPEVAKKSHIDFYPRPEGAIFERLRTLDDEVVVWLVSPTPAKLLVWIDSPTADGGIAHAETEITVGTPAPPVPPDPPDPPVPPVPPIIIQPVQIITVEETEQSTAAFSKIRNSKTIRDWADQGGHRIYFLDKDSATKAGGSWKTWADRAVGKTLPYLFIAPYSGGEPLKECEAPLGVTPFLTLLQKYGGVGKPIPDGCSAGVCPK